MKKFALALGALLFGLSLSGCMGPEPHREPPPPRKPEPAPRPGGPGGDPRGPGGPRLHSEVELNESLEVAGVVYVLGTRET